MAEPALPERSADRRLLPRLLVPSAADVRKRSKRARPRGPVLRMELKHLEQIVAICNAGGLSKAARILRISQPSLSKSIARLESQLGIKLFNRTDGGATPTIYGRYIADRSAGLLSTAAALAL